jgi:PAP2 superfamily protein
MEDRADHFGDLLVADMSWASWDFLPSPWSAGTLLINSIDDSRAPFVGYAAPGVSLCGESGLDTASWRCGGWTNSEAFLLRRDPDWVRTVELDTVRAEIPDDFDDWALDATAAHVERLRALAGRRPQAAAAADLADRLHAEMEMTVPGALERLNDEFGEELLAWIPRRPLRAKGWARSLARSLDWRQAVDVGFQAAVLLGIYLLYRRVREPGVAEGMQVNFAEALELPVGGFLAWVYGLGHVVLPIAFLAWVYFRRHHTFALLRNTLVVAGGLVVAAYLLYSPGRVYAEGPAQSLPSNALATMPALHLVAALALAWFGVALSRSLLARACWVLYPLLVATVLVAGGFRYPEFTIGFAVMVLSLSLVLVRYVAPRLGLGLGVSAPPRNCADAPIELGDLARHVTR